MPIPTWAAPRKLGSKRCGHLPWSLQSIRSLTQLLIHCLLCLASFLRLAQGWAWGLALVVPFARVPTHMGTGCTGCAGSRIRGQLSNLFGGRDEKVGPQEVLLTGLLSSSTHSMPGPLHCSAVGGGSVWGRRAEL